MEFVLECEFASAERYCYCFDCEYVGGGGVMYAGVW